MKGRSDSPQPKEKPHDRDTGIARRRDVPPVTKDTKERPPNREIHDTADASRQRIENLLRRVVNNGNAPSCQEALDRVQLYGLDVRPGKETHFDPLQRTIFIKEGLSPRDSVAAYTFAAMQATHWYETVPAEHPRTKGAFLSQMREMDLWAARRQLRAWDEFEQVFPASKFRASVSGKMSNMRQEVGETVSDVSKMMRDVVTRPGRFAQDLIGEIRGRDTLSAKYDSEPLLLPEPPPQDPDYYKAFQSAWLRDPENSDLAPGRELVKKALTMLTEAADTGRALACAEVVARINGVYIVAEPYSFPVYAPLDPNGPQIRVDSLASVADAPLQIANESEHVHALSEREGTTVVELAQGLEREEFIHQMLLEEVETKLMEWRVGRELDIHIDHDPAYQLYRQGYEQLDSSPMRSDSELHEQADTAGRSALYVALHDSEQFVSAKSKFSVAGYYGQLWDIVHETGEKPNT